MFYGNINNEFQVPVDEVVSDLISLLSGTKGLENKQFGFEFDVAEKTNELQRARSRYDDVGKIEYKSVHFKLNLAIGFLWPYVLISLLGLKIARVKYF